MMRRSMERATGHALACPVNTSGDHSKRRRGLVRRAIAIVTKPDGPQARNGLARFGKRGMAAGNTAARRDQPGGRGCNVLERGMGSDERCSSNTAGMDHADL